ncbi:MAG: hypothetical protein P8Q14_08350 [Vicingaceae bacterium]|nr:hypothetical protein [Vicingaceae bacterium]
MKFLALSISILISSICYSQSTNPQSVLKRINVGETNKVILDLSVYNTKDIINFKDELSKQKMQIDLVDYDQLTNQLTFIYNGYMDLDKILPIFELHGINHIKNTTTQLFKN